MNYIKVFDTHLCTKLNNAKYCNSFFELLRINLVRVRKFYVLIKLYHSRFKLYMNDNIVLHRHPFLSLELRELEISSQWHFIDFDL